MPRRSLKCLIVFIAFPFVICCNQKGSVLQDQTGITAEELREHLEFLASEATEGRLTGSLGYRRAANYVAGQFESYGLLPGWEDSEGKKSYLQPVPFVRYSYGEENILTLRSYGKTEEVRAGGDGYELSYPGRGTERIPIDHPVFIGYGIHEPDLGWDDYSGLDVEGKLVMMLAGYPGRRGQDLDIPSAVVDKYRGRASGEYLRLLSVLDHKAAGIIVLPDRQIVGSWDRITAARKRINFAPAEDYKQAYPLLPSIPVIIAHKELAGKLFEKQKFNPISQQGEYRPGVLEDIELGLSVDVSKGRFDCYNIIGFLPGHNPDFENEFITVSAHLDHLGKIGGSFFHGANDDASGCALILELSEELAQNPLSRPLLFILFTAEEQGHYGSLHFCTHPTVPLEKIKLHINIEQIGAKSRNIDGVWAVGPPSQKDFLEKARRSMKGLRLRFNDIESQIPLIRGSDTWSFYRFSVPSILLGSGGFPEYHTPLDTVDLIDFDHLQRATLFTYSYLVFFSAVNSKVY